MSKHDSCTGLDMSKAEEGYVGRTSKPACRAPVRCGGGRARAAGELHKLVLCPDLSRSSEIPVRLLGFKARKPCYIPTTPEREGSKRLCWVSIGHMLQSGFGKSFRLRSDVCGTPQALGTLRLVLFLAPWLPK